VWTVAGDSAAAHIPLCRRGLLRIRVIENAVADTGRTTGRGLDRMHRVTLATNDRWAPTIRDRTRPTGPAARA